MLKNISIDLIKIEVMVIINVLYKKSFNLFIKTFILDKIKNMKTFNKKKEKCIQNF